MAKDAKFGVIWEEDLFAPAYEDSRSTAQLDAFLGAQMAWLEASLRKGQSIVECDEYGRPQLPKGAQQHWGKPGNGVLTAFYIDRRSGRIRDCAYTMPSKKTGSSAVEGGDVEPVRKPRPDLTTKGTAMVGDFRTDALHQALEERPIGDDQLIAMLVLALGGQNVTVMSGVAGRYRASSLGALAATLTEGGAVTRDLVTIRQAARQALVEVLSCRENQSASGIGARYAGVAIDADAFLPNMATEEFLPALSRAALAQCASTSSVAPQARVKDTRAALIAQVGEGTFIYPGARFAPTEEELEAHRERARSLAYDEGEEADNGDGEDGGDRDSAEDDADLDTSLDQSSVAEDRAAA
jgi:ParB family chromosome partitioning protein